MILSDTFTEETGLVVVDLRDDAEFASRQLHPRDAGRQMSGLQRLSRAFVEDPNTILQELVNIAIDLCEADSAGISIEKPDGTDDSFYNWIAAAGDYEPFFNAMLPRYPSACGICLERREAQHFRVGKRFFDILGVEAALVADGLLLPWFDGEVRGTIFVIAHSRSQAFDMEDVRMMRTLANFAAMAMRNRRQQEALVRQAELAAAASMADSLAHKINNPLQSLTNLVYLGGLADEFPDAAALATAMKPDLERLSLLVRELLAVPTAANARYRTESGSEHSLL
jgi:signal transduction histidine kinase